MGAGAFILVALQAVAGAGSNTGKAWHYGWQPIGTFASERACVDASNRLSTAGSFQASGNRLATETADVVRFVCLPTGAREPNALVAR